MRLGALVQARMGSTRLPGKVLGRLGGGTVLGHVLERLGAVESIDELAVVTSTDPSDDPIADYCGERGVRCERGALDDVLGRLARAAERLELDAVQRVCGDSPFLDQALVVEAIEIYRGAKFDLVTNVFPRSFPVGQSVEILSREALALADAEAAEADDREHATRFFYRHPDRFRIENLSAAEDHSDASLAVDTAADAAELAAVVELMDRPAAGYSWREVLALRARVSAGGAS